MNIDRAVLVFAGSVVLTGIILSLLVHPWWIALSAFAGLNMIQSAYTGFCPAALVMKRFGLPPGSAYG